MTVLGSTPEDAIRRSIRLYLDNKRLQAFESLGKSVATDAGDVISPDVRDSQSILRSVQAMLELLEGLLSGSAETISFCLDDFWEAEKLANGSKDKEWIGNRISRGLCYMFGGLVQMFIGSYVKAGVNITVAYKLIRAFENDVLAYNDESDKDMIRSLGLLVLALLNFFAMVIPPSVLAVGEILGLGPSRSKFQEYIRMCSEEKGIFAYIAKLFEVYSVINSKNFIFDTTTPDELKRCRALMDECMKDAPYSVIIRVMNASVCLGEGRRAEAVSTLTDPEIEALVLHPEWSTMRLAVSYKLGVAYLCSFEFENASRAFEKAADAIQASGRWHYIPFMRSLQGMSYLASESYRNSGKSAEEIRSRALMIFAPAFDDRDLSDTVVLPGDYWGSRRAYEHSVLVESFDDEALNDWLRSEAPLTDIMFALITCLYQFDKVDTDALKAFIKSSDSQDATSAHLKVVTGEYYRKVGRLSEAVACFDDALSFIDSKVAEGEVDRDSVTGFALVFQGAALAMAGEPEAAREALADLDEEIANAKSAFSGWKSAPETGDIKPGNLVKLDGREFDLILSFRRSGLKRLIDDLSKNAS